MRTKLAIAVVVCTAVMVGMPSAPAAAGGHAWRTTLHYRWSGYDRYGTTVMTLRSDGTVSLREGGRGTWRIDRSRHSLVMAFTTGCGPAYAGTVQGMEARGTMHCGRYHGRWFIDRLRPANG